MLKDVVKIIERREMMIIGALLVPIAAIEVSTLVAIRMFFLALNAAATAGEDAGPLTGMTAGLEPGTMAVVVGLAVVIWLGVRGGVSHLIWTKVIRTITGVQARVLDQIFLRFVSLPMTERVGSTTSEQKHILLLSAQAMFHQVLYPLSTVVAEVVIAVAIIATLLVIEPVASILLIGWIGLFFAGNYLLLRPKAAQAGRERWHSLDAMRQVMDGALGDLRWVKITNTQSLFRRLFGAQSANYTHALAKDRALSLVPRYVADIAIVSSILLLFVYFTAIGSDSSALFSGLALFAAAALRLLPALYRVISLSHSLSAYAPDLGQVVENLNGPKIALEAVPTQTPTGSLFKESLQLQDIRYRYPSHDHDTLSDVSLSIHAGDRVLITGASGSGKSTLLSLVFGLLEPDAGTIFLDRKKASVLDAVRGSSVALVSQDPFITTGTVADNIAFPHPSASIDTEKARALLVALGLDWALERTVGENGTQLSGGERQRLAIARALYLSPSFLVLDEATSQMDEEAARRAYELVFQTCPAATVLLCTHQTFPHAFCKRHLEVERGGVTEVPFPSPD